MITKDEKMKSDFRLFRRSELERGWRVEGGGWRVEGGGWRVEGEW
jgi:hypothetical protein